MTLFSILLLGFVLGMRHATDSDHVVAVTTIVSRQRRARSAAMTGVFWGIGHGITLLLVGGAIILCGVVIPKRLGLSLEFCVALMLILLGVLNLCAAERDRHSAAAKIYCAFRPVIIGVVHGLAGSAGIALLLLPMIQNPVWALMYLSIFGLGTIAGMMLITAAIAVPVTLTARFNFFHRHLGTAAGFLSVCFGFFLAYQIGFVDGLFR